MLNMLKMESQHTMRAGNRTIGNILNLMNRVLGTILLDISLSLWLSWPDLLQQIWSSRVTQNKRPNVLRENGSTCSASYLNPKKILELTIFIDLSHVEKFSHTPFSDSVPFLILSQLSFHAHYWKCRHSEINWVLW